MTAVQRQHRRIARASGRHPKGFNTEDVRGPRRATEFELTARKRAYQSSVALRGPHSSSVLKNFLVSHKKPTDQITLKHAPVNQRSAA